MKQESIGGNQKRVVYIRGKRGFRVYPSGDHTLEIPNDRNGVCWPCLDRHDRQGYCCF